MTSSLVYSSISVDNNDSYYCNVYCVYMLQRIWQPSTFVRKWVSFGKFLRYKYTWNKVTVLTKIIDILSVFVMLCAVLLEDVSS